MIHFAHGYKDKENGGKIFGNAITLSAILSMFMMACGILFQKPLLKLYGAEGEIFHSAAAYTRVLVLGSASLIYAQTLNSVIRSMGYAKRAMINFTVDIVTNISMDALFLFVFHMEIQGAALATILSNCVCILMAVQFLLQRKNCSILTVKRSSFGLSGSCMKEMLMIGIPSCIMQVCLSMNTLVYDQIGLKYGGTVSIAVYGVISTLSTMLYMPMIGLLQGMQPIIGYNLGAGRIDRVRETLQKGIKSGVIFGVIFGGLLFMLTDAVLHLFGGGADPAFMKLGRYGLRITVITFPLAAIGLIVSNYFQYVKKPVKSLLLTLLRQVILIYPQVVLLPIFFGINGIFYAGLSSDLISFVVTLTLLYKEKKNLSEQIQQNKWKSCEIS